LVQLIDGSESPSNSNLLAVASPSVVLNAPAIEAFSRLSALDQSIYVHKLAQAIAAERIAEKVRIAKQILMSGEQVPEIYGNKAARSAINNAINFLDQSRQNISFNGGKVYGSAARIVEAVMQMTAAQASESTGTQPGGTPQTVLNNGAMAQGGSQ